MDAWRMAAGTNAPVDRLGMNDARLWHPWLRINRVLREMLHTRWCAEALWAALRKAEI
jgi:hypothetical protein